MPSNRLTATFTWGMLSVGVVFGAVALTSQGYMWFFAGLWLVIVQLFWCIGFLIIFERYRVIPSRRAPEPHAKWHWAMSWYGAVFMTLWFAGLVAATLVAPLFIVAALAS